MALFEALFGIWMTDQGARKPAGGQDAKNILVGHALERKLPGKGHIMCLDWAGGGNRVNP